MNIKYFDRHALNRLEQKYLFSIVRRFEKMYYTGAFTNKNVGSRVNNQLQGLYDGYLYLDLSNGINNLNPVNESRYEWASLNEENKVLIEEISERGSITKQEVDSKNLM